MSFKLVAQVFEIKVGNPLRKMVLIKLADQANDEGACWPSYESIAKGCEITRRSVITHIKWLEKNGFLWIERRYNTETQKNNSNVFHLTLAKGMVPSENDSPQEDTNTSEGDALGGELDSPLDSEGDALPSEGDAPKPITEPTIKPINESIKAKTKKNHDIPDDFKPTDKQVDKMNEYGINIPLFLETFESGTKAKGIQYKCWTSALTTWINNEIKFNKLVPLSEKPFKIDDEDWSNPNAPANYQNTGYHPSHQLDKPMIDTRPQPTVTDNWHWKEPLPGMSIPETEKYLKANKRKGENANKAYQRLLAELQEAV